MDVASVGSYRFGVLLKVGEHPFNVFEVGGERRVVKGEVPLPGGAALPTYKHSSPLRARVKEKQRNKSFSAVRNKNHM